MALNSTLYYDHNLYDHTQCCLLLCVFCMFKPFVDQMSFVPLVEIPHVKQDDPSHAVAGLFPLLALSVMSSSMITIIIIIINT